MTFITEWVMQIIVFILIGTIIELLLPNNTMKKYVNIVVGLLLLLILAKPILFLFSTDVTSHLERIEETIFQDEQILNETEYLIEKQKIDIQAEQDAYIWNEVKSQLINEANPVLNDQYNSEIIDIAFTFDEVFVDKYDNLNQVIVSMKTTGENQKVEAENIQPIIIDTEQEVDNKKAAKEATNREPMIKNTLEELWGLNKDQIEILWEGGTS